MNNFRGKLFQEEYHENLSSLLKTPEDHGQIRMTNWPRVSKTPGALKKKMTYKTF